jgi:hypothetical protein
LAQDVAREAGPGDLDECSRSGERSDQRLDQRWQHCAGGPGKGDDEMNTSSVFGISAYFVRDISQDDSFNALERILRESAPRWSSGMKASSGYGRSIRVWEGGLREAILSLGLERSPELLGWFQSSSVNDRHFGECEVNGATKALCVIPSFDEEPVEKRHSGLAFSNHIALQVFGSRLEGRKTTEWIPPLFKRLCDELDPVWAHAETDAEFYAKAMFDEDGSVHAIGIDHSRYLRGLFALNYFGEIYTELIGRDRLTSIPCGRVEEVASGVLVETMSLETDLSTAEACVCQETILEHLGRQFFFSREDPDRPSVAPDWTTYE